MAFPLFQIIARHLPNLKHRLKKGGMDYKPEEFIKRTFLSAFYMSTGIVFFLALILAKLDVLKGVMVIFIHLYYLLAGYLFQYRFQ